MLAVIYFVQSTEGGPIKIGTTENLESRIVGLRTEYGCAFTILGVHPGSYNAERELIEKFAAHKTAWPGREHIRSREVFLPDNEILDYIHSNCDKFICKSQTKPRKIKRRTAYVRMYDIETIQNAKKVAALRKTPLLEYLSSILNQRIEDDLTSESHKLDAWLATRK